MMGIHSDSIYEDVERQFLNWRLIDTYEDTDDTTAFDYDSGTIPIHNIYKVIVQVQSAASGTNLDARVNADDSANYDYQELTAGTYSSVTGETEWRLSNSLGDKTAVGILTFRGGNLAGSATTDRPCLQGSLAADSGTAVIGTLRVDYADVDQIRVYSTNGGAETGRLRLYGLNL